MKPLVAALLGCAVGSAVTFALFGGGRDPASPPGSLSEPSGGSLIGNTADPGPGVGVSAAPQPTGAVDLAPVLARLEALTNEVAALHSAAARNPAAGERVAASAPAAFVDPDALADALQEVERRKLEAMGDDELLRAARVAGKSGDPDAAVRTYERLLQRSLTPEQRAATLQELAMAQRGQKTDSGLAAAERTWRQVVDEFGMQSDAGRSATYQLIWTASYAGDAQRALDYGRSYLARAELTPMERTHGRWAVAIALRQSGDSVGARAEFEQLLRDTDQQPGAEKLRADIQQRLANW